MTGMFMGSMYSMPYMPSYPLGEDSYSNQVFLNDLTGLNWYTPPFNMPMHGMGMNESLFDYSYSMPMPYAMPGFDSYYQNMDKYYENMMNNQINYQQRTREADITLNAAQRSLKQNGKNLRNKIVTNEQDQVMNAFNKYVESVQEYYGDKGSYEDLKNTALEESRFSLFTLTGRTKCLISISGTSTTCRRPWSRRWSPRSSAASSSRKTWCSAPPRPSGS